MTITKKQHDHRRQYPLTARQKEILDFIKDVCFSWKIPPTVREIGEAFDNMTPNGVRCHLVAIESKGYIELVKNCARNIVVIEDGCCCFCGANETEAA